MEDDPEGRPNRRLEGVHPRRSRRTRVAGESLGLSPSSPVSDLCKKTEKKKEIKERSAGALTNHETRDRPVHLNGTRTIKHSGPSRATVSRREKEESSIRNGGS